MTVKLLLDEMTKVGDVGIVHSLFDGAITPSYVRRRSYNNAQSAAKHYFEYCDKMSSWGYKIKSKLGRAWYYEVTLNGHIVETVEIQWPKTDWEKEMKLLERKKK